MPERQGRRANRTAALAPTSHPAVKPATPARKKEFQTNRSKTSARLQQTAATLQQHFRTTSAKLQQHFSNNSAHIQATRWKCSRTLGPRAGMAIPHPAGKGSFSRVAPSRKSHSARTRARGNARPWRAGLRNPSLRPKQQRTTDNFIRRTYCAKCQQMRKSSHDQAKANSAPST